MSGTPIPSISQVKSEAIPTIAVNSAGQIATYVGSTSYLAGRLNYLEISQNNAYASNTALLNTTSWNFRISRDQCQSIRHLALSYQLANSHPTDLIWPSMAFYHFSRIDFSINGLQDRIYSIYPEQMEFEFQFMTDEQVRNLTSFNAYNLDYTTFAAGSESPIGALGVANYTINLTTFISQLNPATLKGDLIIQAYLATNPAMSGTGTLVSGSTPPVLRVHYYKNDKYHSALTAQQSIYPSLIDYNNFIKTPFPVTLTAGTQTKITLNGVIGSAKLFGFVIRTSDTSYASDAIADYIPLDAVDENRGNVDLVTAGNVSILNGAVPGSILRGYIPAVHTVGTLSSKIAVYFLFMSSDFGKDLATGSTSGFYQFRGTESLLLTPGAGYAQSGNPVVVTVFTYNTAELEQDVKGMLRQVYNS